MIRAILAVVLALGVSSALGADAKIAMKKRKGPPPKYDPNFLCSGKVQSECPRNFTIGKDKIEE